MKACDLPVACALAVLGSLGCGEVVAQPIDLAAVDGSAASLDSGMGLVLGDGASPPPSFCSGRGPIAVPGTGTCIGDLSDVFRFAVCACSSLDIAGTFSTDSFDSTRDAGPATGTLASIGCNGEISTDSMLSIAGSLWTGGPGPDGGPAVTLGGGATAGGTIANDVHSASDMEVGGKYLVRGDVWSAGSVIVDPGGSLAVLGSLYLPATASAPNVQATLVHAQVPVTAPCSCATPIDVPAVVAAYADVNDDVSVGLTKDASLSGTVVFPCGRYAVAGIVGDSVVLRIGGRVAVFVTGDISVTQDLKIDLAPDAELDLFVAGGVSIMGAFEIGDPDSPSRTRVYVGGATVALSASATPLAANLYAPHAVLELASDLEMWGAIFADRLQLSGNFAIHYDTSVLQVAGASGCEATAGPCRTCNDCGGATPACKAGSCAPCTTTADCCAPLGCASNGRCQLMIR